MKTLQVPFNLGIQSPPKIGTLQLKLTSEGKAAYAQNTDFSNDEYGEGAITPGPSLTTITGNSELTEVPIIKQAYSLLSSNIGYVWFGEGNDKLRRIKDVEVGETPSVDATGAVTVTHSDHTGIVVDDIVLRNKSDGTNRMWIVGKDATDGFIQRFTPSGTASLTDYGASFISTPAYEHKMVVGPDNTIYISRRPSAGNACLVSGVPDDENNASFIATAIDIPWGQGITALEDWNDQMVIAIGTADPFTFATRKAGGKSGIYLWDYFSPSFKGGLKICPSSYISAAIKEPDGNLLVFGGLDDGRTTLYEFTGYGFNVLFSYIGDMPRNRHSIEFDNLGRVNWLTCDGQWLRFNKANGKFEHLGTVTTTSSAGGILAKGVSGSEFILASGSGTTYTMKRATFGSYCADGLVTSGIQSLPQGSTIQAITLPLTKPLASGEKLELRLYKNGDTNYTTYLTMDYDTDGAISSKKEHLTITDVNNYSLGVAFTNAEGATTAPPVLPALVDVEQTN